MIFICFLEIYEQVIKVPHVKMQFFTKFFNSRKLRCFSLLIIILMFLFLMSINYSVYVKAKAYEIYINFDKKSDVDRNLKMFKNKSVMFVQRLNQSNYIALSNSKTVKNENSNYKISNASSMCSIIPPYLNRSKKILI